MRAVNGSIVSSEPIPIRRAAAILSKFAKADAGAPAEVAAYVRRASKAFDDLYLFHREIRGIQKNPSSQIQNLGVASERGDNGGGIHVTGEDWDRKIKKKKKSMKVTKDEVAEGNPSSRTHERDVGLKNLGVESERGENGGGVHVIGDDGDRKMKKMRKEKVKGVHERNDEGRKRNREAMEVRSDSGDRNEPHKQKKRRRMEAEH